MQTWIALSEIVRNLGLALAAFGGLLLAWWKLRPEQAQASSAALQADLARRAHVADLFNRAVGQLLDERLEIRLGAIYLLRTIGVDFPDLADPSFELLQAHLRERVADYGDSEPPIDVRAIADVLKLRIASDDPKT